MALQSQTIDVPLIALNQSWPTTAGIAGRLIALNNAIAKRWQESDVGSKLRVEKRDGFTSLGVNIHNATTGLASTKTLDATTSLVSRGSQLIALGGASAFGYSPNNTSWSTPDYTCPGNVLNETGVHTVGTVATLPDSCHIAGLTFHLWASLSGPDLLSYYSVVDNDGTIVHDWDLSVGFVPMISAKCVSDGARFWVIVKPINPAAPYAIVTLDLNGVLLGSDVVTIPQDGTYFDILPNTQTGSNGFVFIQRSGGGPNFSTRKVTWNGAAVVVSAAVASAGGCSTGRISFLANSSTNRKYYAISVDGGGPYNIYLWTIDDVTLVALRQTLVLGHAALPMEMTGWVNPVNPLYTVALSFLDAAATQLNYTEIWTWDAGTATLLVTRMSLTAVSRAFKMDAAWYFVAYYQSNPSALSLTNNIQQSTFYLVDLSVAAGTNKFQVCGEWNKGTAYADWQRNATPNYHMHLSSVNLRQDGTLHFNLSYRARSFTTAVSLSAGFAGITFHGNKPVNTVGIKDFGFGQAARRSVEFANETLFFGPRTTSWTGTPSNHGISLVSELIAPVVAVAAVGLSQNATYEVVCVVEWTDANGNRVRSVAGPPFAFTTGAGERQVTYSGYNVQNDVLKNDMVISLYRTAFVNGIQSQQHYKVTNDLQPLVNAVGIATWSFVDTMTDAAAAASEILYTDKNFIDQYPCPPCSDGCADAQRSYVVGYDGAVWFSGTKAEGDTTWFSPAFRLLLNNDVAKSVALLDTVLVIFGSRNSIYVVQTLTLPANDGSGSIPVPVELPLSHGCTGPVAVCSLGIVFPSTQGGAWLITRDFKDIFIGKAVKTFIETNGPIVDICVDANQRIACLLGNGSLAVYDSIVSSWYTWSLPFAATVLGVNDGQFVTAFGIPTVIAMQTQDEILDDTSAIITSFQAQFQLGGVRNFKRIWDMQIEGVYRGSHNLTVNGYFDDNLTTVVETYSFIPDSTLPYIYDLPPKVEECANLTLEFIDSFPVVPSAGFALEMVSFELGVQPGLDRLSPSTRRKSAS